jgi:hypothetical protein
MLTMPNPNHDRLGRFSSGDEAAANGDQLAAAPSDTSKRHVPGHGVVDRNVPVIPGPRLSRAARERIIANKATDQRRYPLRSDAQIAAKTDLQKPMASLTSSPGRFRYQK